MKPRFFRARKVALMALLVGAPVPAAASFYGKKAGSIPVISGGGGPVSADDINVIENLGQKVPSGLQFTDGRGNPVALDRLLGQGKPVIVTLGYYHCPLLCNLVHEGLVKGVRGAGLVPGKDFLGLAVSVDPKEDPKSANTNQNRLLRALQHPRAEDWPFTLDQSADMAPVRALSEAVGFRYKYDAASKQFAHAAVAFVLTPEGTISRYMYGVDFKPRDLRFAVVEAGGGRVGTTLDRVLLSCFRYDPFEQRYTPYAMAFVRVGAGLSGVALAGLLAILWRKEILMRRRRAA